MVSVQKIVSIVFLGALITSNCTRATLKTFVDQSIDPSTIHSVAIFPMRNVRLLPDEAREINRGITEAFHTQNPNVNIVGPSEAVDMLSEALLSDKYSDFLRNYATSGVPNVKTLNEIGDSLKVDAIIQGEVFDIKQIDGQYGFNVGSTSITIRYVMLSTHHGEIIWEATSRADQRTATTVQSAPPLYSAIKVAQDKILTALPRLGD